MASHDRSCWYRNRVKLTVEKHALRMGSVTFIREAGALRVGSSSVGIEGADQGSSVCVYITWSFEPV